MQKSIRQLATDLEVSHTAIRQAMADLGITGEKQGHGKPTLLNEAEQEQLASKFFNPVASVNQYRPAASSGLAVRQSEALIPVHQTQPISLTITDSTAQIAQSLTSFYQGFDQGAANSSTVDNALLQQAVMEGAELGARIALAKFGAMTQSKAAAEFEIAKKSGLVAEPEPTA
jgi:hypothetical protein